MVAMEQHRRPRRSFPNEYKVEVVELCRTSGRSIAAVARDLDLSENAVRRWVRQAEGDAGRRDGLPPPEREELARRYPEDRATGYRVGDLRGAVSVRVPLATAQP